MADLSSTLAFMAPEALLVVGALALLLLGAFGGKSMAGPVHGLSAALLILAGFLSLHFVPHEGAKLFGGVLVEDHLAQFGKIAASLSAALTLLLGWQQFARDKRLVSEFAILTLFAVLGMFIMVSAKDLLAVYVGVEMQSLALYVLAASNRGSLRSSESGLKYFVLGALSSGLMLYGMSLIYGYSGSTDFVDIAAAIPKIHSVGLVVGVVFMISGLAFKVSAVPFHMWTPDVYEGAPTPVTAFFATAPKFAAMVLLIRFLNNAFGPAYADWSQVVVAISVLSMMVGYLTAVMQTNIKRIMAYSSVANMGYALIALATGTQEGYANLLFFMVLYLITTLGLFACILAMRSSEGSLEQIDDLSGLSRTRPGLALLFTLLLFSVAGVPPLAGFFGKYFVFVAAVHAGMTWLAIVGAVASVVGAFVYIRLVKLIWFDEPTAEIIPPNVTQFTIASGAAIAILPGAIWLLPAVSNWSAITARILAHG